MRILFLLSSPIWKLTLPEGFKELGHEIKISGPITEKAVNTLISDFNPNFLMSMGMGDDQTVDKQLLIRRLSKTSKIPHIYWSIEDPAFMRVFSLPYIQRAQPDFVFTLSPDSVKYYKKIGIKSAHLDFGYAPKIHHYAGINPDYKCSIALVANAYPKVLKNFPEHYRHRSIKTLLLPLLKNNIRVDIWGRQWNEMDEIINFDIPGEWLHGYLPYDLANKVYSSADIVLGLQDYPTQITQRTYEVLASGGLLLTDDTPGVKCLFKDKEHLIVSSTAESTLKLAQYYLDHPDEGRKIARSGCSAVSGNSYKDRANYIISVLENEKIIKI